MKEAAVKGIESQVEPDATAGRADRVLILSTEEEEFLNDLGNGYIREFVKNGATFIDYEKAYLENGKAATEALITRTIEEKGIDVLVYQSKPSDFHFGLEFFKALQKMVFTVMMVGDSDHYFDLRDVYYGQCMDLVVVYDYTSRFRFEQYGVEAMSFYSSFDGKRYRPLARPRDMDVSFVGDLTVKVSRRKYLERLRDEGIEIQAFGTGTPRGQLTLDQMVEVFNRTKINLNFTRISTTNALGREPLINRRVRQMKGRIAEIALSGGFVLTEHVPGIDEVFEPGREVEVFHTEDELVEKTRYYLDHPDERRAVAERGHRKAIRDYETSTAVPRLIDKLYERRAKGARVNMEVVSDKRFARNSATFRVGLLASLLKAGRWAPAAEELGAILRTGRPDMVRASKVFAFTLLPSLKRGYLRVRGSLAGQNGRSHG